MAPITPWHYYCHFIDIIFGTSLFCYCWFIVVAMFELHCDLHSFYLDDSCSCIVVAPTLLMFLCHGYWQWPHCWYVSLFFLFFLCCVICLFFFFFVLFAGFFKFFFIFLFVSFLFSCFSIIFGGPPISFSYVSTSSGTNLIQFANGSDIFVDCSWNDELFISSSSINEFSKLPPLESNRNLFDHFFNPYIYEPWKFMYSYKSIFLIGSYCSSFYNCCCVFYIKLYHVSYCHYFMWTIHSILSYNCCVFYIKFCYVSYFY
jgi:hypothetical protein